jgi:hypothetical protein
MIDAETEFLKLRKAEGPRKAEIEWSDFLSFPPLLKFCRRWFMAILGSMLVA